MKEVVWTDGNGLMHRSVLKDDMPEVRPNEGVIIDPPDVIHKINWDDVAKALHNELVRRGLFTYNDVMVGQNLLSSAILAVLRKRVKQLYREERE
jgi:hypothetical protein